MRMEMKYRRRRWITVAIFLGIMFWAFDATTPDECKVPTEQMSSFCKEILYP